MIQQLLIGILLALFIAAAAYRARSLSRSGAAAAVVLGTVIFGLGGLGWAALLLAFFISSSALSRLFKRQKSKLEEKFSKGSRRDAAQVLANGGIAGVFVLLHLAFPLAVWPWVGFAGALAAANADTWATELGVLSPSAPRLVTTGRAVERGTSGGVTVTGTLAALAGALLIALLAAIFWQGRIFSPGADAPLWWQQVVGSAPGGTAGAPAPALPGGLASLWLAWIALAGLLGSLFDSLLGATVQAIFYCPACQKETERSPLHTCGARTTRARGWAWMDNDAVNTLCTLLGAVLAAAGIFIFF